MAIEVRILTTIQKSFDDIRNSSFEEAEFSPLHGLSSLGDYAASDYGMTDSNPSFEDVLLRGIPEETSSRAAMVHHG